MFQDKPVGDTTGKEKPVVEVARAGRQRALAVQVANGNAHMYRDTTSTHVEPPTTSSSDPPMDSARIQFSVGLTGQQINTNKERLGLTAGFDQYGAKTKSKRLVSHLTLHPDWAQLPATTHGTLQWWIPEQPDLITGTGPLRHPRHPAFPVFWSQLCYHHGLLSGEVYCYIGHYICENFDTDAKRVLGGIHRQALAEFEFVEFKQDMADLMAEIARRTQKRTATEHCT